MKRSAAIVWDGNIRNGQGSLSSDSGALKDIPYSYRARFGSQVGTNPEELIAAAHASCFSMALANELTISGLPPTKMKTRATVELDLTEGKWSIHNVELFLTASLGKNPSLPFLAAASRAKASCPVSKLLNARVTLHTQLQSQYLRAEAEAEVEVVVYTSTYCQVCGQAKKLLESQGIRYREVDLDREAPEVAETLKKKTGRMSVPQIFVGDHFIGSYEDLVQLDLDHGLKKLLQLSRGASPVARAG